MKPPRVSLYFLAIALPAFAGDAVFDRVEQLLTVSTWNSQFRARVSGTVELEGYDVQLPAPGVIQSADETLFVPRLSVFLDAQVGPRLYGFLQARADHGFDPSEKGSEVRLDEWALRYTPWRDGRFNLQLGRFASVMGNWTARHGPWNNPFITAPVPYENLTGIWDVEAIRNSNMLLQWSHVRPGLPPAVTAIEKSLRLPIVWGPAYSSGVAVSGDIGRFRYAMEAKLGALSSRPAAWLHGREQRHHPTFTGRLGYRPNQMWNLGVSASQGVYLREFAERSVAPGFSRGDYRQSVIAADFSFAWHHVQVWAEIYRSSFAIPRVGDADTTAYYVESKYKFTPRLFGALRWNQQVFGRITDRGVPTRWDHDIWRVDFAPGFRFTPHTQLKLQYSLQHGDGGTRTYTRTLATQFTLRF